MPIKVPDKLPANQILNSENIFVMTEKRALTQDIRPLRIALVNLMPLKSVTETQLLRLLGNTPLQVEVDFINTVTHNSKNTPLAHLRYFYKDFESIRGQKYDGMIITGAPVEQMEFEDVDYWEELTRIMEWSNKNVTSTFHICWAAQAGLYYHYGIPKYPLAQKLSGVFKHKVNRKRAMLMRGFDEEFYAPHSRYTTVREEDVRRVDDLQVMATSDEAGVYVVTSRDKRRIFVTGHAEYDRLTLHEEFLRDCERGLSPLPPRHYYPDDNPAKQPKFVWRAHANLLFTNWLNYHVYQTTPYDITKIQ